MRRRYRTTVVGCPGSTRRTVRTQVGAPKGPRRHAWLIILICPALLAGCGGRQHSRPTAARMVTITKAVTGTALAQAVSGQPAVPPLIGTTLANPVHHSVLLQATNVTTLRACFALPAVYAKGRRVHRATTVCASAHRVHKLTAGYAAWRNLASLFKNALWVVPIPNGFRTSQTGWQFLATAHGPGGTVTTTVVASSYPR